MVRYFMVFVLSSYFLRREATCSDIAICTFTRHERTNGVTEYQRVRLVYLYELYVEATVAQTTRPMNFIFVENFAAGKAVSRSFEKFRQENSVSREDFLWKLITNSCEL